MLSWWPDETCEERMEAEADELETSIFMSIGGVGG